MDYGKLAYLKVEDLERLIAKISSNSDDFGVARVSYDVGRLVASPFVVTDVKKAGSGNVCFIIKIIAKAKKDCSLDVFLGSSLASRQLIEAGKKEYLVLIRSKITEQTALSIRGESVFVDKLELMVIGGAVTHQNKRLVGDCCSDLAVVVQIVSEQISVFSGAEQDFNPHSNSIASFVGKDADVAFALGKFFMLILDSYGNVWLWDIDEDKYKFLAWTDGNSLSICDSFGTIGVALIHNNAVYVCDLHSQNDIFKGEIVEHLSNPLTLRFAKGTDHPVLTVNSDSGSYFTSAHQQTKCSQNIEINIRAWIS